VGEIEIDSLATPFSIDPSPSLRSRGSGKEPRGKPVFSFRTSSRRDRLPFFLTRCPFRFSGLSLSPGWYSPFPLCLGRGQLVLPLVRQIGHTKWSYHSLRSPPGMFDSSHPPILFFLYMWSPGDVWNPLLSKPRGPN